VQKMILLLLNCYRTKSIAEEKKEDNWVRPWLLRRPILGQYERLMRELSDEDVPAFKNFVRVEPEMK